MMRFLMICVLLPGLLSLAGCSDDGQVAKGEHVWKEQTKALDKAKEVEKMLQKSAMNQMKQADRQSE